MCFDSPHLPADDEYASNYHQRRLTAGVERFGLLAPFFVGGYRDGYYAL